MDSASEVIAEGLEPVLTIDGLAQRLGATKGSFYHHFRDRTDLLLEIEKVRVEVLDDFAARADGIENPEERFRTYCVDAFSSRGYLNTEVFLERERVHNLELDKAMKKADDKADAWQLQAVTDLGFSRRDAGRYLRVLKAAAIGLILLMMHEGIALPLEERIEFADTIVDLAMASASRDPA